MYGVVGYLVETLTDSRLGDFFHSNPWRPIGMNEIYLGPRDAEGSGLLLVDEYYYNNSTKGYVSLPHAVASDVEGADSITVSTVLDYTKYLRGMMTEAGPCQRPDTES
ncbi:hypothetical protein DL769_001221 [Monosporascus sp. CRB-8-3]|nr:hypothetical protein DL769_001221 [Monosporascus sp. CRB-8-3]